jgi:hypothetical protein
MDPLGLGLENFNALGMYRDKEHGQPIDAGGKLITGESFKNIHELKRILKGSRRRDFYHCLTEKFLTYALGRGPEYHDVEAIDRIVEQLERDQGRFSTLLMGVIESAPFQKRRTSMGAPEPPQPRPAPKSRKTSLLPGPSPRPERVTPLLSPHRWVTFNEPQWCLIPRTARESWRTQPLL